MNARRSRRLLVALLAPVLVVAAACGSDADDSAGGDSGGGGGANEEKVIGIAAITLQSPAVGVQIETAERAAELLGWKTVVTNANGDPAKMAADITSLVNQDVDAILDIAISPAQAQEGFRAAKEKDIPIIAIGAPLDDPQGYFAATYAPSDEDMSVLLAEQMIKDLDGKGQALSLNASGLPALKARFDTLVAETKDTDIEVAVEHETDLANAVQDTQTAVANALRANKDINVIWALQDFEFVTSLQTIATQNLQKAAVYGYYPPPEALQVLRDWKEGDARGRAGRLPDRVRPVVRLRRTGEQVDPRGGGLGHRHVDQAAAHGPDHPGRRARR